MNQKKCRFIITFHGTFPSETSMCVSAKDLQTYVVHLHMQQLYSGALLKNVLWELREWANSSTVQPYNGELLSNWKQSLHTQATAWINLTHMMVNKGSNVQKSRSYMIPVILSSRTGRTNPGAQNLKHKGNVRGGGSALRGDWRWRLYLYCKSLNRTP